MDLIFFSTIKDSILIVGSITSTIFAFRGYNKWKKEHIGKLKYELCRSILKTVYTIQDDYKYLRSPLTMSHEMMPDYTPKILISDEPLKIKESENLIFVFTNRMKYLNDSCNNLQSLLPEIELEFGLQIKILCNDLLNEIINYRNILSEYIQIVDKEDVDNKFNKKIIELRSVIYNVGDENIITETFKNKVDKLKCEIQIEIKKHLN